MCVSERIMMKDKRTSIGNPRKKAGRVTRRKPHVLGLVAAANHAHDPADGGIDRMRPTSGLLLSPTTVNQSEILERRIPRLPDNV